MPQKYRVRNWKSYNNALKRRGDLYLYFDATFFRNEWHFKGTQKAGGRIIYSDAAIEMLLAIKFHFRLPLRQAQGFVESILRRLKLNVTVPDYSTVSRRSKKLSVKIKHYVQRRTDEDLHLLLDSTGLSIYSGTYFHTHKHLKDRVAKTAQSWKKLHIAFDLGSSQVMSAHLSDSHIQDAAPVEILTDLPGRKVASICGDRAYDKRICYRRAHALNAAAIIPPIKVARLQCETRPKRNEEALSSRDRAVAFIRQYGSYEEGVKEWKRNIGYHQRSRIEALNQRFKRAFGHCLSSKLAETRRCEAFIKLNILNKQITLGKAEYERVT
jgi:hypothetical protein